MCYYNGIRVTREEKIRLMDLEAAIDNMAALNRELYNGFAYDTYPIVKPINGGSGIKLETAVWGFLPGNVKNAKEAAEFRKKYITLDAKGEELFNRPLYTKAAQYRRCLIPTSGFYDWRHFQPEWSKKPISYPYYVTVPNEDKEYAFMAGIWQPWTDKETGETFDTFAMITTKANELMELVHNTKKRMPTILTEELAHEWIQDGLTQERITQIATFQIPYQKMKAYPINKDFRETGDPTCAFTYSELPELVL